MLFDCTTKSRSGKALREFVAAQQAVRRKEKGMKDVKGKSVKKQNCGNRKEREDKEVQKQVSQKVNKDGGHKHERRKNGHGIPRRNHQS